MHVHRLQKKRRKRERARAEGYEEKTSPKK